MDEQHESIGSYVGRIVHAQATAPYVRRIAELEAAYDLLYTDCEQGQRAAEEEIAELQVRLLTAIARGDGLMREVASLGDMLATNRLAVKQLQAALQDQKDEAERDRPSYVGTLHACDPLAAAILADRRPSWHGLPDPRISHHAGDPRGPHEEGCDQHWMHTGPCYPEVDE